MKASAQARFLHLGTIRSVLSIATSGEIHGHAAAAAAFAVAATPAVGPFPQPFSSSDVIEAVSSDGPRRLFFQPDGTPFTPGVFSAAGGLLRQKPDVTAADGVSVTAVFSSPFYGTSAAAPHAAAIAALLLSATGTLTPAQARSILTGSAIDIMAAGPDRDSGAGIVMATAAMLLAGVPGHPFVSPVTVQVSDDPGNGNGAPEAGEGARLVIPLANYGGGTARGISATLTSSTPGIILTQPSVSAYADLAASASTTGSPYRFTVAADFPCPKVASFTLTVTWTGPYNPQVFAFTVPIGPPNMNFSVTTTLDGVPPTASAGVATATGLQAAGLKRDGRSSVCDGYDPFKNPPFGPNLFGTGTRRFDAYAFNTCQNSVAVTSCSTNAIRLFSAAACVQSRQRAAEYKADAGARAPRSIRSTSQLAQPFVIDVHRVNEGGGIGTQYTLNWSGVSWRLRAAEPPACGEGEERHRLHVHGRRLDRRRLVRSRWQSADDHTVAKRSLSARGHAGAPHREGSKRRDKPGIGKCHGVGPAAAGRDRIDRVTFVLVAAESQDGGR